MAVSVLFLTGCLEKEIEAHGFERSFASTEEIKAWAVNSAPDTGRFHPLQFLQKDIMLVYRSHDDVGRKSDLGVYQKTQDGTWHLLGAQPPTQDVVFEAKIHPDKMEFNVLGKPEAIVLTITEDDLLTE